MLNKVKLPDYQIVRLSLDDLVPYDRNARVHSDEQVEQIADSIRQFGFTIPILADEDGTVIAGHGRLMAAKKLELETVPVIIATGWSEEQRRAYTIADNQLTLNGEWDESLLRLELGELKASGFDVGIIGIDAKEMSRLLTAPSGNQPGEDDVPEEQSIAISHVGDVWLLGQHRLICGDCTDPSVVESVLNGAKPHLMVTDPPYGVQYDADWRTTKKNGDGSLLSTGKGRAKGKVSNDERADWRDAWKLFPGDVAYIWHSDRFMATVQESAAVCGFKTRNFIIWAKNHFAVGRGDYHPQHEPALYAVRDGKPSKWRGGRKQSTIWEISKPQKSETGHSTQKPVECMRRPIENHLELGEAVYDPFVGSGTTIIAAEDCGRIAFAVELNPLYVDIAIRRWQAFTGEEAILEETGETFAERESSAKNAD